MFGLFGKKDKANSFKTLYAGGFIPSMLEEATRAEFLSVVGSEDGTKFLAQTWNKLATESAKRKDRIPPTGLEGDIMRDGDHIIAAFTLPGPTLPGEPYFTVAVIGPITSDDWAPELVSDAPLRCFIGLCTEPGVMEIGELTESGTHSHGSGPEPDLFLFIEWVVNHTGVKNDHVSSVRSDDEAMLAAIAKAKETLPEVTRRFVAGELENFSVKVPVQDGDDVENFWLSETTYANGKFSGILDAEPQVVGNVTPGQSYEVDESEVKDWLHLQDGKMAGNFTLRAMLPNMTPADAAKYGDILA